MEEKGKIICKKSDNKAFKLGDNWYNLNDNVVEVLAKLNKGDEVVVTYEKKGVSRYVSKLVSAKEAPKEEPKKSTTGYSCEICGKELKTGKFKKCFMCNKSGATKKETATTLDQPKNQYKSYDNPEKTAQIQRGNAINAAAYAASGTAFNDPEVAAQFVLELAERFLVWLRSE